MTGAEAIIIGLIIAGTTVTAYSQHQQGKQQAAYAKAQSRAQAAWNMYNAKLAQREAEAERKASAFEATQHKRRAKALLSRQRAIVGASGLEMEGSPLLVAEDTAAQLAKEEINLRLTGQRKVAALRSQSILDVSKAQTGLSLGKFAAAGYKRAGTISATGSLLSGAGQAGYMAGSMKGKW